jgi:N-acetylglutamate synthase and related acetyltransferases
MNVTLEPAYDEPEEIRALFQEYTEMLVENDPGVAGYLRIQNYDAEVADLRKKYGPPDGRLYLARSDGRTAGCIALHRLAGTDFEAKRLFVRPEFRGAGIGRTLMERVVADARGRGCRRLLLDTLPFLTSAVRMYRALGFREIPPYNNSPLPESIFMQMDL